MRPNRLRELLRAGQPTFGTHIHTVWPTVAELAGHAGVFDYVEFVGEYAPYDLFALENLARAVETFPHMTAMMKIEAVLSRVTWTSSSSRCYGNSGSPWG